MEKNHQQLQIINATEMLGFSEKMSAVYLATLELGSGSVNSIAKLAAVERVNTYYILEKLKKEGYVYSGLVKNKIAYFAESPKKLLEKMDAKTKKFSEIMPQLMALENSHATKPVIRFYEGVEGIKKVFLETLLLPEGSETLAFASYQTVTSTLQEFVPFFIKKRVAKKITQRLITEDTPQVRKNLAANDKRDLRKTRLIDREKFPFEVDQINIFGNKIFIASYKDLLALVIESPSIAKTMRSIFELAWIAAK